MNTNPSTLRFLSTLAMLAMAGVFLAAPPASQAEDVDVILPDASDAPALDAATEAQPGPAPSLASVFTFSGNPDALSVILHNLDERVRQTDAQNVSSLTSEAVGTVERALWENHLNDLAAADVSPEAQVDAQVARFQAELDAMRAQFLRGPISAAEEPGDEMIEALWQERRESGQLDATVSFRFLFNPELTDATRLAMQELRERIAAEPERFREIAEEYVARAEAARTGFSAGTRRPTLIPELAEPLFAVRLGDVTPVLELPTGLMIARVEGRTDEITSITPAQRSILVQTGVERMRRARLDDHMSQLGELAAPLPSYQQFLEAWEARGSEAASSFELRGYGIGWPVESFAAWMLRRPTWPLDERHFNELAAELQALMLEHEALDSLIAGKLSANSRTTVEQTVRNQRMLRAGRQLAFDSLDADRRVGLAEEAWQYRRSIESADPYVDYRVLYVRPRQRAAEGEPRTAVPQSQVLAEVETIRTEISEGLSFSDAVVQYCTDADNRAVAGLKSVRLSKAGEDQAVVRAAARLEPGELTAPIRLRDGFALAQLQARSDMLITDDLRESQAPLLARLELLIAWERERMTVARGWLSANLTIDQAQLQAWAEAIVASQTPTE